MNILKSSPRLLGSLTTKTLTIRSGRCESHVRSAEQAEREAQELLDGLYSEVRAQRFEDIVVLQTKFNADPRYLLLASAFNSRHLVSGTEMLNRQYKLSMKKEDQEFANMSLSQEWNVLDFHSVVVHLLSKQCREHYDIEQLWAVGEKFDDHINFPEKYRSASGGSTSQQQSSSSGRPAAATATVGGRTSLAPSISLAGVSIPSSRSGG